MAFCPVCGARQEKPKAFAEARRICTENEYYREVNHERLRYFKKCSITLTVIFVLLSALLISFLWLSVGTLSEHRKEAVANDHLIDLMINSPGKLDRNDAKDIIDLFEITDDEQDELEKQYNNGKLRNLDDVKEYVTLDRALTLLLSDTVLGNNANTLIAFLMIMLILVSVIAFAAVILVISAIITNSRTLSVWALTLTSLICIPSLLTMLPLFVLTFTVEKMIAKNDRIYERYITKI